MKQLVIIPVNKREPMDPIKQHIEDKMLQTEGIPDPCSRSFLGESGIH